MRYTTDQLEAIAQKFSKDGMEALKRIALYSIFDVTNDVPLLSPVFDEKYTETMLFHAMMGYLNRVQALSEPTEVTEPSFV